MNDKITLLIRNKYRPELFARCLDSINNQTYGNLELIIGIEDEPGRRDAEASTRFTTQIIGLQKDDKFPAYWNLYANQLKTLVNDGHFMFLDNDDFLSGPGIIEKLMTGIKGFVGGVITQFLRNGRPKPDNRLMDNRQIIKGRIGGGCLLLHSKYKDVAEWDGYPAADFRWLKEIEKTVPLRFEKLVVQITDRKLFGK